MQPQFILLTLPDNSSMILRVDYIKLIEACEEGSMIQLVYEDGMTVGKIIAKDTVRELYAKIKEVTRFP